MVVPPQERSEWSEKCGFRVQIFILARWLIIIEEYVLYVQNLINIWECEGVFAAYERSAHPPESLRSAYANKFRILPQISHRVRGSKQSPVTTPRLPVSQSGAGSWGLEEEANLKTIQAKVWIGNV